MASKVLIFAFVAVLQINAIFTQCINSGYNYLPSNYNYQSNYGLTSNNCNNFGNGLVGIATANNNNQATGLSIYSENEISGPITVQGTLPFASAVAFDGSVQSTGEANVQQGCGSTVALNSAGFGSGSNYGPGNNYGPGSNYGLSSNYGPSNSYAQVGGLSSYTQLGNTISGYNGVVGFQNGGCGCGV